MKNLIQNADEWSNRLWFDISTNWEQRKQDHNYRDLLARPGLTAKLKMVQPIVDGMFLDLGCGEGAETVYLCEFLHRRGFTGRMYGFDTQERFTNAASILTQTHINCTFGSGSFSDFLDRHDLRGRVDLVTSLFVLQDLPGIEEYASNIHGCLKQEGTGLLLLVHPKFGKAMLEKGALRVNHSLNPPGSNPNWEFAAEYPIVEESGGTFFVPYFHRKTEYYEGLFREIGFRSLEFFGLRPSREVVRRAENEKLSPFYWHEGNVYYPEIVENESSLLIKVKK